VWSNRLPNSLPLKTSSNTLLQIGVGAKTGSKVAIVTDLVPDVASSSLRNLLFTDFEISVIPQSATGGITQCTMQLFCFDLLGNAVPLTVPKMLSAVNVTKQRMRFPPWIQGVLACGSNVPVLQVTVNSTVATAAVESYFVNIRGRGQITIPLASDF